MSTVDAWGNEVPHVDDEMLPRTPRGPTPLDPRKVRLAIGKNKRTNVNPRDPAVLERWVMSASVPETPFQALVEAGQFEEPEESALEKELRFEPLRRAIENCLSDRERWVIEAKFWRGLGLDLTAAELGMSKTHVARIRDSALAKLAAYLGDPDDFDTAGS